MITEALNQITGIFDRRFLLNAFFPCLIFWGLLGVVGVVGGGWDLLEGVRHWNQQDATLKALQLAGFLAIVVFSSNVLYGHSGTILRFFEGYWNFPLAEMLSRTGRKRHQAILASLDVKGRLKILGQELGQTKSGLEKAQDESLKQSLSKKHQQLDQQLEKLEEPQQQIKRDAKKYRYYPDPKHSDKVLPTSLGNILLASELYPLDRFGVDAVLIWPRLFHLFPDRYMQFITEALSSLNFVLALATLSGVFGAASGLWLIALRAPAWLFLLCFWGGFFVAWLAYRSATSSAVAYAEQVKVGFDLYRHELIRQLRLKLPENPLEEKKQWLEIWTLFFRHQVTETWAYQDPKPKKEGTENG